MNGIFTVAVIACLVFCAGLGFGIMTLQQDIETLAKEIESLRTIDLPEEHPVDSNEHDDELEDRLNRIEKSLEDMKQEFAGVKRSVYGTADVTEFARLKTVCYETLPQRIEKIEDFINGKPEVIRIEDENNLEELRKALRVSAFDIKEDSDERAD